MRKCGRSRNRQVRDSYWNKVDGENWGVDSRDKVRHIERSDDQLYVTRMMFVYVRVTSDG